MRNRTGLLYWGLTGAAAGFGLIGLMSIGLPFLILGLIMAVVGVWRPGIGGVWGILIGFGGLPALVFASHIVAGIRTTLDHYCAQQGPGTLLPPPAGPVECAYIPGSYYVMFVIFAAIAFLGVALGLFARRRLRATAA